jgi:cell division septum initiation protein DivIVA
VREPVATDDNVKADEVSAEELLTTVVPITRRGYAPDVIDPLLERAAATIERLRALDDPALEEERRERADVLQRTLVLAQARADQTVTEAQAIAAEIRSDAEASARLLVADAEQIAAHLVETERARAQAILEEALASRDVVEGDIAALEQFASQARARVRDTLEGELGGLDRLLNSVSGRPRVHEIDLTDPTLAGWAGAEAETALDTMPGALPISVPEPTADDRHGQPIDALIWEGEPRR